MSLRRHVSASPPRFRRIYSSSHKTTSDEPESSPDAPAPRHSPPANHHNLRQLSAAGKFVGSSLPFRQVSYASIVSQDAPEVCSTNPAVMLTDSPPKIGLKRDESATVTNTRKSDSSINNLFNTQIGNTSEPRLQLLRSPSENKLLRPLSATRLVRTLENRGPRSPPRQKNTASQSQHNNAASISAQQANYISDINDGVVLTYVFYALKITILTLAIFVILVAKFAFFFGRHIRVVWRAMVDLFTIISAQLSILYGAIHRRWRFNLRRAVAVGLRFEMRALRRQSSVHTASLVKEKLSASLHLHQDVAPIPSISNHSKDTILSDGLSTLVSAEQSILSFDKVALQQQ